MCTHPLVAVAVVVEAEVVGHQLPVLDVGLVAGGPPDLALRLLRGRHHAVRHHALLHGTTAGRGAAVWGGGQAREA